MNILDNAKRHFSQRRELRGPIEVPEWGDEGNPLLVYYQIPNMALKNEMAQALAGDNLEGIVTVLILMAMDADGKHLFSKAQKPELMRNVDPAVIERITREMDIAQQGES